MHVQGPQLPLLRDLHTSIQQRQQLGIDAFLLGTSLGSRGGKSLLPSRMAVCSENCHLT